MHTFSSNNKNATETVNGYDCNGFTKYGRSTVNHRVLRIKPMDWPAFLSDYQYLDTYILIARVQYLLMELNTFVDQYTEIRSLKKVVIITIQIKTNNKNWAQ